MGAGQGQGGFYVAGRYSAARGHLRAPAGSSRSTSVLAGGRLGLPSVGSGAWEGPRVTLQASF